MRDQLDWPKVRPDERFMHVEDLRKILWLLQSTDRPWLLKPRVTAAATVRLMRQNPLVLAYVLHELSIDARPKAAALGAEMLAVVDALAARAQMIRTRLDARLRAGQDLESLATLPVEHLADAVRSHASLQRRALKALPAHVAQSVMEDLRAPDDPYVHAAYRAEGMHSMD